MPSSRGKCKQGLDKLLAVALQFRVWDFSESGENVEAEHEETRRVFFMRSLISKKQKACVGTPAV